MDAFTFFLVELALWNILLATLAFLFGLMMGHWIWGSFKKRLEKSLKAQKASEEKSAQLHEEVKELRNRIQAPKKETEDSEKEDLLGEPKRKVVLPKAKANKKDSLKKTGFTKKKQKEESTLEELAELEVEPESKPESKSESKSESEPQVSLEKKLTPSIEKIRRKRMRPRHRR